MIAYLNKESKPLVAGLDLSLRKTGICVGVAGDMKMHTLRNSLRDEPRLIWIRDRIRELVVKLRPQLVAIEGYSHKSIGRKYDIGGLHNVVTVMLHEEGVEMIKAVPPKSLKRFVTGNGGADKKKMIQFVQSKWGIEAEDDDQADAAGLAMLAHVYLTRDSKMRHELEIVRGLRYPTKKIRTKFLSEAAL